MWPLYALLSALGASASDACTKKVLAADIHPAWVLFLRYLVAIPLLLPLLGDVPNLTATFWLVHLPWLPLETTAIYLYVRAIQHSPLSLTLPFLALTPLFLIPNGWLLLGERVGWLGIAGILLVVGGSYTINAGHARTGWLGPFRAMLRERGTRLMIVVAFLYSLTSICGKMLIEHSSPTYFAVHYAVVMTVITAPLGWRHRPRAGRTAFRPLLLLAGGFFALMIIGHMLALQTAYVAYMISIKRLSGVFGVLFGRLFFDERELGLRLLGSIAMVAGGLLILLD